MALKESLISAALCETGLAVRDVVPQILCHGCCHGARCGGPQIALPGALQPGHD